MTELIRRCQDQFCYWLLISNIQKKLIYIDLFCRSKNTVNYINLKNLNAADSRRDPIIEMTILNIKLLIICMTLNEFAIKFL